jgi:hypothetical protein
MSDQTTELYDGSEIQVQAEANSTDVEMKFWESSL